MGCWGELVAGRIDWHTHRLCLKRHYLCLLLNGRLLKIVLFFLTNTDNQNLCLKIKISEKNVFPKHKIGKFNYFGDRCLKTVSNYGNSDVSYTYSVGYEIDLHIGYRSQGMFSLQQEVVFNEQSAFLNEIQYNLTTRSYLWFRKIIIFSKMAEFRLTLQINTFYYLGNIPVIENQSTHQDKNSK